MSLEILTERQRAIYLFIEDKILNRGFGPTVREICEEFGIKSPNGVVCHLNALVKKGFIVRYPRRSRAIELVNHHGLENNGAPSAVARRLNDCSPPKEVDVESFVKDMELIQVEEDSLVLKNIVKGDYVFVIPAKEAAEGSFVLVEDPSGVTSVKYLDGNCDASELNGSKVIGVATCVVRPLEGTDSS